MSEWRIALGILTRRWWAANARVCGICDGEAAPQALKRLFPNDPRENLEHRAARDREAHRYTGATRWTR